ncbi:MAG TPA: glycosyl hydrolase family 28-related protein, partial [Flavisolibacter sp.]|nr:glycosyl hydrolase family 28-related protein [Flavisolibacter sp.]
MPGPRTAQGKPVRLLPVPLTATPAEIQALLKKNHYLYFKPGSYNIGQLEIKNWNEGVIWGAGRLTTNLNGSIIVSGSTNTTIGNVSIINNKTPKGEALISVSGSRKSQLNLMSMLASAGKDGIAIRLQSPGQFIIQGCQLTGNDIGLSIEHTKAEAVVFGGNMQANRVHMQQRQGHLAARALGLQMTKGDADIVLHTPSPLGYHLIEGLRSEGNNSANENEVLVQVPPTTAAVNVALRANGLGSMAHYADYNANGTLLLQENVNYPGAEDRQSIGVTVHSSGAAKVISIGNKYGLSYDAAPGPFAVSNHTAVQSIGDLWMLPNTTDYSKHFNEPITREAMQAAKKALPGGVSFYNTTDSAVLSLPDLSAYKVATCPRIANLAELMLNVKDFGAVPNDGKDDRVAIQRALDAAEKGGTYEPVYFPAGRYEVGEPLFLDHLAGGGFWGDGADRTVLVS